MTSRWDQSAINYTDTDRIKEALVGRSITSTTVQGSDYDRVVTFNLDDGSKLAAHATDGGCACSNGCFTVDPGSMVHGTITNVEVKEYETNWSSDPQQEVEPGSISDGSATIKVFVYGELGEQLLVSSEGGDNGYYGWGFWLSVEKPAVSA